MPCSEEPIKSVWHDFSRRACSLTTRRLFQVTDMRSKSLYLVLAGVCGIAAAAIASQYLSASSKQQAGRRLDGDFCRCRCNRRGRGNHRSESAAREMARR